MRPAQVAIWPAVDGRHRELVVMDKGKDLFMSPVRERAEPSDALAVGVDIGASAHIIPVRPAAQDD